ncbi:MAG: threonine/serine dehydratase [Bacteroidota bacterium]|nr:threonine/serine dehydratase [Bacteroidota bacterium]
MNYPSLDNFNSVLKRISPYINKTPIISSSSLNDMFDLDIFFKLELMQKTGSFKSRGAINKVLQLSEEERSRGVVAISAGNHAQATSWACSQFGTKSKIIMPHTASQSKIDATESYGGEVILTKEKMMDTCQKLIDEENLSFVHPFDDLDILMGQGTVALEVINEIKNLDYAFISIGGGGLIAGMACVLKQINPKIKIIGVEPINSNVMTNSIKSGKPEIFDTINNKTIADTLAAPFAGKITFEYVKEYVDDIINVSEDEMIESLRMMIERLKIVPEPSASACFVPIVFNKLNVPSKSKCLVVVCGGNIDLKRIKSLF